MEDSPAPAPPVEAMDQADPVAQEAEQSSFAFEHGDGVVRTVESAAHAKALCPAMGKLALEQVERLMASAAEGMALMEELIKEDPEPEKAAPDEYESEARSNTDKTEDEPKTSATLEPSPTEEVRPTAGRSESLPEPPIKIEDSSTPAEATEQAPDQEAQPELAGAAAFEDEKSKNYELETQDHYEPEARSAAAQKVEPVEADQPTLIQDQDETGRVAAHVEQAAAMAKAAEHQEGQHPEEAAERVVPEPVAIAGTEPKVLEAAQAHQHEAALEEAGRAVRARIEELGAAMEVTEELGLYESHAKAEVSTLEPVEQVADDSVSPVIEQPTSVNEGADEGDISEGAFADMPEPESFVPAGYFEEALASFAPDQVSNGAAETISAETEQEVQEVSQEAAETHTQLLDILHEWQQPLQLEVVEGTPPEPVVVNADEAETPHAELADTEPSVPVLELVPAANSRADADGEVTPDVSETAAPEGPTLDLDRTLKDLTVRLELSLHDEATALEPADLPEPTLLKVAHELAVLLPEDTEPLSLTAQETLMTPEFTEKLITLVRELGYEQPAEAIVSFAREYGVPELIELIAETLRPLREDEMYEFFLKQKTANPQDEQTYHPHLAKFLFSLIAHQNHVAEAA